MTGGSISHYRILSRLGAGGMGEVYLAEDEVLRRSVAIKVLPSDVAADEAVRRLVREARSAASLEHPNICAIHEIGSHAGRPFIVMQYIEGETLAARLKGGRLDVAPALDLGIQITDALSEAHHRGIIHRDIKPHNIMVTPRGQVKMLDFGLARPVIAPGGDWTSDPTATALTSPGAVAGTLPYMSPEQARGEALDARSDIFSCGVVLYEMLCGRQPFAAPSAAETLSAVLTRSPGALGLDPASVPSDLERIVAKALHKDREERYQDVRDLHLDLKAAREEVGKRPEPQPGLSPHAAAPRSPARRNALVAAGLVVVVAGGALYVRRTNTAWAAESVARVAELARAEDFAAAYDLASRIRPHRPDDRELERLMTVVTDDLSVSTEPPGATVSVKRHSTHGGSPWQTLGQTPLNHRSLARGDYVLRLELAGHESCERSISSAVTRSEFARDLSPAIQVTVRLLETGKVPPRMTLVPGGRYKLVGYGQPTQASALLGDYFIDKYEVSNREYQAFVSAGGYRDRAYWRYPFVDAGRTLSWDEAMRRLVDRTGLPGPRGWSGGSPPEGHLDHPVTGVTWYEAAAYAASLGKTLPTIYQWEKAARDGVWVVGNERVMPWGIGDAKDITTRANFDGPGTVPVESLEFGMSPYGCFNMAGNVTEWLRNEAPGGFLATGGCWADPPYIFGEYGTLPGLHSSDRIGLRCALTAPGVEGDQGGQSIRSRDQAPVYARSSDGDFRAWLSHYRYDKTPLDARVEETSETAGWKLEKVTFRGAGDDRTYAYLYLPKSVKPPFQMIQFVPGSPVYEGQAANWFVESGRLAGTVKAGRALFIVALRGYVGRKHPAGYGPPDRASVAYRDEQVRDATDLRRGLDYLETRPDIDLSRLAFMNISISRQGIVFSAVEPRYRAVVLLSSGLYPAQQSYVAEANPVLFAPHIKAPKLMLNGRWDEDFAFKTEAEPLFKLLSEPKRLELYDGGHVPPVEIAVPVVNRFLDETLGPVRGE